MKTGTQLIQEERERQISKEGWTAEHDDTHNNREMAAAAAAYLQHYVERSWLIDPMNRLYSFANGTPEKRLNTYTTAEAPDIWPEDWDGYWKPKDMMSDLIRAGALIAAEIDRLQRHNGSDQRTGRADLRKH